MVLTCSINEIVIMKHQRRILCLHEKQIQVQGDPKKIIQCLEGCKYQGGVWIPLEIQISILAKI